VGVGDLVKVAVRVEVSVGKPVFDGVKLAVAVKVMVGRRVPVGLRYGLGEAVAVEVYAREAVGVKEAVNEGTRV